MSQGMETPLIAQMDMRCVLNLLCLFVGSSPIEGGDVRDDHRHACTRQDEEVQ